MISSPAIRVNGKDMALDAKESNCDSCGSITGESVNCRVWTYQGMEYAVPSKGMMIDRILREIYQNDEQVDYSKDHYEVPENLKNFFAAKQKQAAKSCRSTENCFV